MSYNKWFDAHGNFTGTLSSEVVGQCSHSGRCDDDIEFWQRTLQFEVPRELAIKYLSECGAWRGSELLEWDDTRLAQTVLWLACNDIKESGEWYGLVS